MNVRSIKGCKDAQADIFSLPALDYPCCLFQSRIPRNRGIFKEAVGGNNGIYVFPGNCLQELLFYLIKRLVSVGKLIVFD